MVDEVVLSQLGELSMGSPLVEVWNTTNEDCVSYPLMSRFFSKPLKVEPQLARFVCNDLRPSGFLFPGLGVLEFCVW